MLETHAVKILVLKDWIWKQIVSLKNLELEKWSKNIKYQNMIDRHKEGV